MGFLQPVVLNDAQAANQISDNFVLTAVLFASVLFFAGMAARFRPKWLRWMMLGVVAVYRAVGGGWQLREGRDVISDEVKAEMQKTTRWGRMMEPARHIPETSPEDQPVETPKGRPWIWNLLNINK